MNQVNLVGNVTRDFELKESAQQNKYALFTLAVNERYKQEDRPNFIEIVAFGHQAEILAEYGHKGKKLAISGRLSNDQYTDKEGVKVSKVKVILENFEFASSPKKASQQTQAIEA